MSDSRKSDDGHQPDEVSAADERALSDIFASLVADSPACDVSPLAIVKLGQLDQQAALDKKIKRFKLTRNALLAAVLAGVVALLLPHLNGSPPSSTATGSSSTAARLSGALTVPAAGSGISPLPLPSAAASGKAAAETAASSEQLAVAPSLPVTSGQTAPRTAGSAVAAGPAGCELLPARAVAAATSVFPAGIFGAATAATGCAFYGAVLPLAARASATIAVNAAKADTAVCLLPDEGAPCSPVKGTTDAYELPPISGSAGVTDIWVYGGGYEVYIRTAGGSFPASQLIAAARAVISALSK